MVKATIVFIAGALTAGGIMALKRSGNEPLPPQTATTVQLDAVPADDPFQQLYVQGRFAAQRPFAVLYRARL